MCDLQGVHFSLDSAESEILLNKTISSYQDLVERKVLLKKDILNVELAKFKVIVESRKADYETRIHQELESYKQFLVKRGYSAGSEGTKNFLKKLNEYEERLKADGISYTKYCEEGIELKIRSLQRKLNAYQKILVDIKLDCLENLVRGSCVSLVDMLMDDDAIETSATEREEEERGCRPLLDAEVVEQQDILLNNLAEHDRLVEERKKNRLRDNRPYQPKKPVMSMAEIAKEIADIEKKDMKDNTREVADFIAKVDQADAWILDLHQNVMYGNPGPDIEMCLQSYQNIDSISDSKIIEINMIADQLMRRNVGACVKRRRDNINRRWAGLRTALDAYRQRLRAVIEGPGMPTANPAHCSRVPFEGPGMPTANPAHCNRVPIEGPGMPTINPAHCDRVPRRVEGIWSGAGEGYRIVRS